MSKQIRFFRIFLFLSSFFFFNYNTKTISNQCSKTREHRKTAKAKFSVSRWKYFAIQLRNLESNKETREWSRRMWCQRQFLGRIYDFIYSESREDWPSNDRLYEITKHTPWSKTIEKRRLSFVGHVCRLPEDTLAKIALHEALKPARKPPGKPKTTYIRVIKKQLNGNNSTVKIVWI